MNELIIITLLIYLIFLGTFSFYYTLKEIKKIQNKRFKRYEKINDVVTEGGTFSPTIKGA